MKGEEMSAKVLLIEKCGECGSCNRIRGARVNICSKTGQIVNYTSPPPDGCPLLDLDAVLDVVKAACPLDIGRPTTGEKKAYMECFENFRKALNKGGE